jgi:hypothetical protein
MDSRIDKLKGFRQYLLKKVEGLTSAQLNEVPSGFNNNIIWNIGHMTSAQQNMCYVKAGLPIVVDDLYFSPFLPGSKPARLYDEDEIKTIKEIFLSSLDQLQSDLLVNNFTNYTAVAAIEKAYGFSVRHIDDALEYLLHHDGYHLGCVLAMRRLV